LLNNSIIGVISSVNLVPILTLPLYKLSIIRPLKIIQLKTTANGIHAIYLIYINGNNIDIIPNIVIPK
jgi:hypothetical protein